MIHRIALAGVLLLGVLAAGSFGAAEKAAPKAGEKSAAPKAAKAPAAPVVEAPLDGIMGDYVGTFKPAGGSEAKAEAKVVAEAGAYRAILLPAAAGAARPVRIEVAGKLEGAKVPLAGKAGEVEWTGSIEGGKLAAESKDGKFDLKFITRKSPTELAKPPAGAVVLLPYEEGKAPSLDEWTNAEWKTAPDGTLTVSKGDNFTKRQFGDFKLHLEFRIPFEPAGKGQGRGNSGVYIFDRYEIQILDSYGLEPEAHQCGAVYTQTPPKENACFPPGSWQTYEITFRAPRFDADGKKTKEAVVTVVQNGVTVQDQTAIKGPTGAASRKPEVKTGPIKLQDHGHPVKYRNMWLVELKE
jgi:hypothetical protein